MPRAASFVKEDQIGMCDSPYAAVCGLKDGIIRADKVSDRLGVERIRQDQERGPTRLGMDRPDLLAFGWSRLVFARGGLHSPAELRLSVLDPNTSRADLLVSLTSAECRVVQAWAAPSKV